MPRSPIANRTAISPTNFFLRSDALQHAAWSFARSSAADNSADVTHPAGHAVTKWVEDGTAAQTHFFLPAVSPLTVRQGQYAQVSFWVRGGGTLSSTRRVYIQWNEGTGLAYADFNPRTGLVDQSGSSALVSNSMAVDPFDSNWYRCKSTLLTVPAGQEANAAQLFFELDAGANGAAITNVYDGDGASGVYLAGLTLAYGIGVTPYVRTDGAAVVGNARGLVT